jgi:phytanoyl-CoA hydroxylase
MLLMLSVAEASFNTLAEERRLPAFSTWPAEGRPAGYVESPLMLGAADFYRANGFLVIENGIRPEEVEALRSETAAICQGKLGPFVGLDPVEGEPDDEAMRRYLCIHFPHKISDLMFKALAYPSIVETLTSVIGPDVKCMQSMLFIKASGKPGQAWHQDEIYIPTRDRSLTGAWIALDDATVDNGCLWVIPGSHQPGVLYQMESHEDRRFDCSGESQGFPYSNDDAVPVEVKAGSIVFFNGYLLHRSLPNYSTGGFRRSLVNHYMSASSFLPWFGNQLPDGQHVGIADNRDVVLVAGSDPYAYKGVEQRNGAHVRPSGEGGCGNQKRNEEAVAK